MITVGIDIGSVTTKVVVLERFNSEAKVLSQEISLTGADPKLVAQQLLTKALTKVNLTKEDLEYIVSTGYGRRIIEFGDKTVTEITCCAKGSVWIAKQHKFPTIHTIIDLGGQDTKIISVDETGNVVDFVMNDKCAAGTGRFLEVIANVLQVRLDDLEELFFKSTELIQLNSTCTVFVETEVISLIAQGKKKEDIVAGVLRAIAERVVNMVRQVSQKEGIFFCGGGAKNKALHRILEEKLDKKIFVPCEPQFVVALGAALYKS